MAQEPPQPNIIAAGHMAVAGGVPKPQSGCSTTPVWPGHLHLLHVKRASSPAPAKGWAAAENSSFTPETRNYEATKYEDFLYVNICHSTTAPAPPSVPMCPQQKGTIDNHPTPAIIYSLEHCPQGPSAEAKATELCKLMHQLAPWPTLSG